MTPQTVEMNLDTLAGGAIPERFEHALGDVLRNEVIA